MASLGAYCNPFPFGGQAPGGYHFSTGYGIDYIYDSILYLSGPYMYGVRPNATPYLLTPYSHMIGLSLAPVID